MKLSFLGPIQRPSAEVVTQVENGFPGGTVAGLLAALGYSQQQAWFFSVVRAEERLAPDDRVEPTDKITIMLLVGGG